MCPSFFHNCQLFHAAAHFFQSSLALFGAKDASPFNWQDGVFICAEPFLCIIAKVLVKAPRCRASASLATLVGLRGAGPVVAQLPVLYTF